MEVTSNPTENYFIRFSQLPTHTHTHTHTHLRTLILLAYVCMCACVRACACVCVCVCVCVGVYAHTYACMHACMQFSNIKWSSFVGINKNEKIYRLITKNAE
jgi:hypothetical protein